MAFYLFSTFVQNTVSVKKALKRTENGFDILWYSRDAYGSTMQMTIKFLGYGKRLSLIEINKSD